VSSFPHATITSYMACVGGRRTEVRAAAPDLPTKGVDLSSTAVGNSTWTGGAAGAGGTGWAARQGAAGPARLTGPAAH
jgi:hypothetical protein